LSDARDDDVGHLDHEEFHLALAGLAMGDRRFLDVLADRARAQQARRRLSMPCVKTMSWKVALPAPPPAPVMDAELLTPQENDRTSISPLCLSSADSPLMSPILAKMSEAIAGTDPLRD
jgi:hypothetical protein